jgi:hypothetical protein
VEITFLDGTEKKITFFASRLKWSRWAEVTIVPDEKVETLVRTIAAHFASMGGIPLLAVFDRPKTVAISWDHSGKVTEWNQVFAAALFELGVSVDVDIELCWPYHPQEKGSIEKVVQWVKNSFFRQRRFHDEDDLREQLREWLREINECRPSDATHEIPAIRFAEEQRRLRMLKVSPENLALRYPVYVGPTAMVRFEGRLYSMPPESACVAGTMYVYRDSVRIVVNSYTACHPRIPPTESISTLPEHRSARLAALSGKRGKRYLKRQDLLETGKASLIYLTEILYNRSPGSPRWKGSMFFCSGMGPSPWTLPSRKRSKLAYSRPILSSSVWNDTRRASKCSRRSAHEHPFRQSVGPGPGRDAPEAKSCEHPRDLAPDGGAC